MLLKILLMVGNSAPFCSLEKILFVEANSVENSAGGIGQSPLIDGRRSTISWPAACQTG